MQILNRPILPKHLLQILLASLFVHVRHQHDPAFDRADGDGAGCGARFGCRCRCWCCCCGVGGGCGGGERGFGGGGGGWGVDVHFLGGHGGVLWGVLVGGLGESEWAMVLLDLGRWIACDGEAVNIVVRCGFGSWR